MYHQDYEITQSPRDVEIIQPVDGALYYFDPTLPDDSQVIAVRINGRNQVSLYIDDRIIYEKKAPYTYFHKVKRGAYVIRAESRGDSDEVNILVR